MSDGGHWYDQDSRPSHTVVTLTGPNKGKPRPVTVRDAKKFNLSPSVSGIIGMAAAPPLEQWKRDKLLFCAAAVIRDPLEGDQAWAERVLAAYKIETERARDLGSSIHYSIERFLADEFVVDEHAEHVNCALEALDGWCGLDEIMSEKCFTHPLGYGGTVDVHKEGFVADFKTKEFDQGNLPKTYDNHAMQLKAYAEGLNMMTARCAIIYVSTSVPGLSHLVEIDQDELDRAWEVFTCLLKYWQLKNKYVPKTIITQDAMELVI